MKTKKTIRNSILRAAVLVNTREPLKVCDVEIPTVKPEQVLVKVLFSGVCRSQLMEIEGHRGPDIWLPHMLGHEASGVVLKIGEKVKKVEVGDEVILTWIKSKGLEPEGRQQYFSKDMVINAGHITTLSNYTVVAENRVVRKPKSLDTKLAALFGCALPTGSGMVLNQLKPDMGSSVGVFGLGGIGLSAISVLGFFSCRIVCAIDISDRKLELALKLGATHFINPKKNNLKREISKITNGLGLDYCIEAAGSIETIESAFGIIKNEGGRLLFASHPKHQEKIQLDPHDLISGKQIQGSWGGGTNPDEDFGKIYSILYKNNVPIDQLITKTYTLEQVNQAVMDLKLGKVFRPIIKMKH